MIRPLTISLATLFTLTTANPTHSNDYKHVTDAAYCSGVVSRNIALTKRDLDIVVPGEEQNLLRFRAILLGALKLDKIDAGTAANLVNVGQQDADLCWDTNMKCMNDGLQDKTADRDKTLASCLLQNEHTCKRIKSCN